MKKKEKQRLFQAVRFFFLLMMMIFGVENDKAMYPASTIKAFVMASIYDQIQNKKLKMTPEISRLLKNMITISDNESYNQLVRYHTSSRSFVKGTAVVNKYLKKNGYGKTGCHSTLHPSSSSVTSDGKRNQASAKDCGLLLERIYKGTCVSKKYSREMEKLLCSSKENGKFRQDFPRVPRWPTKQGKPLPPSMILPLSTEKRQIMYFAYFLRAARRAEESMESGISPKKCTII